MPCRSRALAAVVVVCACGGAAGGTGGCAAYDLSLQTEETLTAQGGAPSTSTGCRSASGGGLALGLGPGLGGEYSRGFFTVRINDDTGGLDGTLLSEATGLALDTFTLELSDPVGTTVTLDGIDSGVTFAGRYTIVEACE